MAGPTGIGCLLTSNERIQEMGPFMTGGSMIKKVTTDGSTFKDGHAMFETGTPRIAEAIGWGAAVEWLEQFKMVDIHNHVHEIAAFAGKEMTKIPGIKIFGDPNNKDSSGAISFLHDTIQSQDLALLLDQGGYAVRTGHHCAQPLMDALGIPSTNRASFWIYNTREEVEGFIAHLKYICEKFA
jgi:cysteine desulfurase/selenocysteine lyase